MSTRWRPEATSSKNWRRLRMRFHTCQMLPTPVCPALPGAALRRAERFWRRRTRRLVYRRKCTSPRLWWSSGEFVRFVIANLHPVVVLVRPVDRAFVAVDRRSVGRATGQTDRRPGQLGGRTKTALTTEHTSSPTNVMCHRWLTNLSPAAAAVPTVVIIIIIIYYHTINGSIKHTENEI